MQINQHIHTNIQTPNIITTPFKIIVTIFLQPHNKIKKTLTYHPPALLPNPSPSNNINPRLINPTIRHKFRTVTLKK